MKKVTREEEIREMFDNHKAELTKHGDLTVLDWGEPGSNNRRVRYVFDRHRLYVTGDLNEAIFDFTSPFALEEFINMDVSYFHRRMMAYYGDKYDFCNEEAKEAMLKWIVEVKKSYEEDKEELENYETDFEELLDIVTSVNSESEWANELNNNSRLDFISDLEPDYWEWMYEIGREIPFRVEMYLIGLRMASEQLYTIDLENKLENMYESEISHDVYEFLKKNIKAIREVEAEIYKIWKGKYGFIPAEEVYDADTIYMEAIINVMNSNPDYPMVTNTKIGYGMIKFESKKGED